MKTLRRWYRAVLRGLTQDALVCAALAGACLLLAWSSTRSANVPLLLGLALGSVGLCSWLLGRRGLAAIGFTRQSPGFTFAGEPLTVTLTLHNRGRLPLFGLSLAEALRTKGRSGRVRGAPLYAVALGGRSEQRVRYQLLVRRRGVYRFSPSGLSTRFPFGLWKHHAARSVSGRLVVYPRLGKLREAFFEELQRAALLLQQARPCRMEHDFRGLREYRHGDHPKWIHWRSSARRAQLMVREFEEPRSQRMVLLLDPRPRPRAQRGRLPDFERALSFAASLALAMLRRGCELAACAAPPGQAPWVVRVTPQRNNLDELLEALARLLPDPSRDIGALAGSLRPDTLRGCFVLALTVGSEPESARWLQGPERVVKLLPVASAEFGRLFRRHRISASRARAGEPA